jgi:hypothetical protein
LTSYVPALHSRPTSDLQFFKKHHDGFPEEDPGSPAFWWKLGISVALVLLGGVFSGIISHEQKKSLTLRIDIGVVKSR